MTEAWEMRTNFRKPGSQGTLFQVADKNSVLNPAQRWPKGYTPERMREVQEATKGLSIGYPDRLEHEHEPGEYEEMDSYRHKTQQVIARSTVPTEHLKGLGEIHGEPGEGHSGTYWYTPRTIGVDMTQRGADKTLIHELGHHHDNMNDITRPLAGDIARKHAEADLPDWRKERGVTSSDTSMAFSKVEPGVAEAVADNYMMEHYRSPGKIANQQRAPRGAYEQNFMMHELDRQYPGYTDVRPSPYRNMSPVQFDRQKSLPGMDEHWERTQRERAWHDKHIKPAFTRPNFAPNPGKWIEA